MVAGFPITTGVNVMSQNLIDIVLSDETLSAVDAALDTLETHFTGLIALSPEQRRALIKMGDKSEAFCRQAVDSFVQNPGVLPRNFDVEAYQRDLDALDDLRPRLIRLNRLRERMVDSEMALGSDLMTNSLEGYASLKRAGRGIGLEAMRQMLAIRFSRNGNTASASDESTPEG